MKSCECGIDHPQSLACPAYMCPVCSDHFFPACGDTPLEKHLHSRHEHELRARRDASGSDPVIARIRQMLPRTTL